MILIRYSIVILNLFLLISCYKAPELKETQENKKEITNEIQTKPFASKTNTLANSESKINKVSIPDSEFVIMNTYALGFLYEMKYATKDNFLKEAVYSCDKCLVRKEVADALLRANEKLIARGCRIKFYDCYRPLDVQKKMWKIYPDARYVGNPNTSGSIHNRGGAVDITLVDLEGMELEMGTDFDHFGIEAHHAYANLSDTVLANRKLLKETMEANGFKSITSEWWHYNYKSSGKYSLSNFSVKCDGEIKK